MTCALLSSSQRQPPCAPNLHELGSIRVRNLAALLELVASFVNRYNLLKSWEKTDTCAISTAGVHGPKNTVIAGIPTHALLESCPPFSDRTALVGSGCPPPGPMRHAAALRKPRNQLNMLIGYARVSTNEQNLDLQRDALRKAGVRAKNLYTDKITGTKEERPGLEQALSHLREGDTLVVWRLDRLGRSLKHLIEGYVRSTCNFSLQGLMHAFQRAFLVLKVLAVSPYPARIAQTV
jgi:hypothetical protein